MDPKTIIDLIAAFGSIATPILILGLTAVGWVIKDRIERARDRDDYWRDLEEKLRDDRIEVYNTILEPFIVLLSTDVIFKDNPKYKNRTKEQIAQETMLSLEYRQAGFKLALFGSDNVLQAYNKLMQHVFKQADGKIQSDYRETFRLLGNFLLEIRRSVGNETTNIKYHEMLEWFMKDMDEFIR